MFAVFPDMSRTPDRLRRDNRSKAKFSRESLLHCPKKIQLQKWKHLQ